MVKEILGRRLLGNYTKENLKFLRDRKNSSWLIPYKV